MQFVTMMVTFYVAFDGVGISGTVVLVVLVVQFAGTWAGIVQFCTLVHVGM